MSISAALQQVALDGLEAALNRYLRLDPAALGRCAALTGKTVEIRLRGIEVRFQLRPHAGGIAVQPAAAAPDTVVTGTPLALLRAGISRERPAALFAGEVEYSGDVETGRSLMALLDAMEIDWEEQLSRIVGDVVAHQFGNLARGLGRWSTHSAAALQEDIADFLREESRLLPYRGEVEELLAAVDELRLDVDRLEQRYERLQRVLRARRSGADARAEGGE